MFYRILLSLSILFALSVAVLLGWHVSALASQIDIKDKSSSRALSENLSIGLKSYAHINGYSVEIEVAQTPAERAKGLMFREYLNWDKGMFFVFPIEGKYTFWMKNTFVPLDIIWIDSSFKIVHIERNVPPCKTLDCRRYVPPVDARYVLEVNSGWTKEYKIEVGTLVEIK